MMVTHYTDKYYTNSYIIEGETSGIPVEDLLVYNAGLKFKTRNKQYKRFASKQVPKNFFLKRPYNLY